jgi:transcriptional regulator with XRE-family HTH domain
MNRHPASSSPLSDAPSPHALGLYVKDKRLAVGMSSRALSEKIAVHHSTINRLESGVNAHPAPEILERIAKVLKFPSEDLFALAGYDVPEKLPTFPAYLRSKYEMTPEAAKQLTEYFGFLTERYGITEKDSGPKRLPEKKLPSVESADFKEEYLEPFRAA